MANPHFSPTVRPWAQILGSLVVAVVWWGVLELAVVPGYTRTSHVVRAVLSTAVVVPGWVVVSWLTGTLRRPDARDPRRFGLGVASWLVPALVVGVPLLLAGQARVSTGPLPSTAGSALVLVALVLLFEAIPEELIFRDLMQRGLTSLVGRIGGVIAQAALFGAWGWVIGAARTAERLLLFGLFALCLGAIRALGGSVLLTIGFHTVFQFTSQSLLTSGWSGMRLHDPDYLFTDLALGLAPFLGAPIIAWFASRRLGLRHTGIGAPSRMS